MSGRSPPRHLGKSYPRTPQPKHARTHTLMHTYTRPFSSWHQGRDRLASMETSTVLASCPSTFSHKCKALCLGSPSFSPSPSAIPSHSNLNCPRSPHLRVSPVPSLNFPPCPPGRQRPTSHPSELNPFLPKRLVLACPEWPRPMALPHPFS